MVLTNQLLLFKKVIKKGKEFSDYLEFKDYLDSNGLDGEDNETLHWILNNPFKVKQDMFTTQLSSCSYKFVTFQNKTWDLFKLKINDGNLWNYQLRCEENDVKSDAAMLLGTKWFLNEQIDCSMGNNYQMLAMRSIIQGVGLMKHIHKEAEKDFGILHIPDHVSYEGLSYFLRRHLDNIAVEEFYNKYINTEELLISA